MDIRKEVLSRTLEEALADLGDALSLISRCGDVVAVNKYASMINDLNSIIDSFVAAEIEAQG